MLSTFPRCSSKQSPLQRAIGQKIANDLTRDLLRRGYCRISSALARATRDLFSAYVRCFINVSILYRATHETGPESNMIQSDERDDRASYIKMQ